MKPAQGISPHAGGQALACELSGSTGPWGREREGAVVRMVQREVLRTISQFRISGRRLSCNATVMRRGLFGIVIPSPRTGFAFPATIPSAGPGSPSVDQRYGTDTQPEPSRQTQGHDYHGSS